MSTDTKPAVPPGFMRNAIGHLVPLEQVREQDLLRDQVVRSLAAEALQISEALAAFKVRALNDIADLVKIAGDRYQVALGGKKGNLSITSYDGDLKIVRAVAERIAFTEELEAAKALLTSCLERWSEGANPHLRAIVDRAFRTDARGQIKMSAVLDLLRLEIDDAQWKLAMQAIRDSIQAIGTAIYVRVYRRIGTTDAYEPILLDLAGV